MIEGLPIDMRGATKLFLTPTKKLQVILDWMIAEPVDVQILLDAGLTHRAPDLDHPAEYAKMIIDPVERAADHLLRVIAKFVIDGDVWVASDLSTFDADLLKLP